jgi:hypothetical protein
MFGTNQLSGFGGGGGAVDRSEPPHGDLVYWFRADLGITLDGSGNVSAWQSQNPEGGSAGTDSLVQAVSGKMPAYDINETVGSLVKAGVVTADGSDDVLRHTAFDVGSQPIHIFLVFNPVSWTSDDHILAGITTPILIRTSWHSYSPSYDGGAVAEKVELVSGDYPRGGQPFVNGSWHLANAYFNGSSSTFQRDDQTAVAADSLTTAGIIDGLSLFSNPPDTSGYGNIKIAELLIYDAAQTGGDLTAIKNYINDQYGLF